jgi:Ni,Fe-hydrogenase III small subunit
MVPSVSLPSPKKVISCFHANIGVCNGCDLEVLNLFTSFILSKQHLDIQLVRSAKNAEILLTTGSLSRTVVKKVRELKESIPANKTIVAIGTCAIDGGPWRKSFNVVGGIDKVLHVNCFVPGCPPTPDAILRGLELAFGTKKKQFVPHLYKEK